MDALRGSDLILHAGDVGDPSILSELEGLAPVTAVRGNMDGGTWARALAETEVVEVRGVLLYLLHDLGRLDLSPEAAGIRVVVFGHTHRSEVRVDSSVLYFNPGPAGHRRSNDPVSVGRLDVSGDQVSAKIIDLG
jgi:putative phosphoesterase